MIELLCECGHRFTVGDDAAGLTTDCPRCGVELSVEMPGRHEPLAFDAANAPPPREATLIDTPAGTEVPTLPYATRQTPAEPPPAPPPAVAGYVPLAMMANAVAEPTTSFPRDVLRGFRVLFAGPNHRLPLVLAALDLLIALPLALALLWRLWFALILATVPIGWHLALYFRACQAACAGDDQARFIVIDEGVWEDIVRPILWMLGTVWLATAPLWLYWLLVALLPTIRPPAAADLALLGVALFLWPGTVLTLVMGDSVAALTPRNVVRMIFGAIGPYLLVWLALAVLTALGVACAWVAMVLVNRTGWQQFCPLLGFWAMLVLLSLTGMLVMRTIGLMYRHFKHRLPFAAE